MTGKTHSGFTLNYDNFTNYPKFLIYEKLGNGTLFKPLNRFRVQEDIWTGRKQTAVNSPVECDLRGKWDYELKPVYHIGILDFVHDKGNDGCINHYSLMNEREHKKISDKLNFITIELPKFNKTIKELKNELEVWFYCFINLPAMQERPAEIGGPIFDLLFKVVELNKLTTEEMEGYKKSVAEYADVQLMMECSLIEGREEGIRKGRREGIRKGKRERESEIARNLLKMNFPIADIAKATGLTPEQIRQL